MTRHLTALLLRFCQMWLLFALPQKSRPDEYLPCRYHNARTERHNVRTERHNVRTERHNVPTGRRNVIAGRRNVGTGRRNVISRRRNVISRRRNVVSERRNGTRGRTCRGEASPESVYGTHAVNQAMLRPYGGRGHPICGGASVGTGRGNPIGAGASVGTGRGNPIGAGASVGTGRGHPICGGAAPLPSHRSRATIPAIERGTDPERKGA